MNLFEWTPPPAQHNTPDMHRKDDADTSIDASERVAPCRKVLQLEILTALRAHGPMTDGELEKLPQFKDRFGHSTVRKRRSELFQDSKVVDIGERRGGMRVWDVAR